VRTRSCGSSSTDYAGTSSWILRIAISILQYLRRGIADVLAMATVVDVELAVWFLSKLWFEVEFARLWYKRVENHASQP
jgi:hypothetical protein